MAKPGAHQAGSPTPGSRVTRLAGPVPQAGRAPLAPTLRARFPASGGALVTPAGVEPLAGQRGLPKERGGSPGTALCSLAVGISQLPGLQPKPGLRSPHQGRSAFFSGFLPFLPPPLTLTYTRSPF